MKSISFFKFSIFILNFLNFRPLTHFLGGSHAVQWFFALVSIMGFFFALFFLPETHGKKLSEIEAYFQSKSNPNSVKNRRHPADLYKVPQNPKEMELMLQKNNETA